MERYTIEVARIGTASGGWEWFLLVGGERVRTGNHGVGIFTEDGPTPDEVFPRLIQRVANMRIR